MRELEVRRVRRSEQKTEKSGGGSGFDRWPPRRFPVHESPGGIIRKRSELALLGFPGQLAETGADAARGACRQNQKKTAAEGKENQKIFLSAIHFFIHCHVRFRRKMPPSEKEQCSMETSDCKSENGKSGKRYRHSMRRADTTALSPEAEEAETNSIFLGKRSKIIMTLEKGGI